MRQSQRSVLCVKSHALVTTGETTRGAKSMRRPKARATLKERVLEAFEANKEPKAHRAVESMVPWPPWAL